MKINSIFSEPRQVDLENATKDLDEIKVKSEGGTVSSWCERKGAMNGAGGI